MPRSNEDLTPAERAKKFSTGSFTASETGARSESARKARNTERQNLNKQVNTQSDFERLIQRGGK